MSSELSMFLLGMFITMIAEGLTGLAFRKWYRSPLEKRITWNEQYARTLWGNSNRRIADVGKLAKSTDTGLQTLYEVVRAIDKDVKRLKKKAKGNLSEIDQKDIDLIKENYVKHYENRAQIDELKKKVETIGGVSVMPCSQAPYREIPDKNGYNRVNDQEYLYYHGNSMVKPGSTYKQIEFDNGTDMFTIVLNDGRKIASDITHIKNLLLKEAHKLQ